ncbi:hypothetical protein ACIBTV_27070 [Micromonospora sp. NPDC049366]|uniref:hypothetical protein n=1 Tax=Micromonospora sp. NPDC049366 TaxID=3364271 RepID=UPI0037960F2B
MSRLYFHSPSGEAELPGSEFAWLEHLARGPAIAAWDFEHTDVVDRIARILAMVPEVPDGEHGSNYLHTGLRAAQAEERANKAAYGAWRPGQPLLGLAVSNEHRRLLVRSLRTRLNVDGVDLHVAGVKLHSRNVELNTAIAAGSDPIRLAAKLAGWGPGHVWVEGRHRSWLASVIEEGLAGGMFRRRFRRGDKPDGELLTAGWEQVVEFLRARDDEPIVTAHSVYEDFPNPTTHLDWPGRQMQSWDDCSEAEQRAITDWQERWYDNEDSTARWEAGMAWLRERRPWARLALDTLADVTFHHPVTVYDLFAPDRDERVRTAAGLETSPAGRTS